jgi:hypothetical protein
MEIDGCDVVNLAGRSVSCRYTDANLREMPKSRVDSTLIVGEAVERRRSDGWRSSVLSRCARTTSTAQEPPGRPRPLLDAGFSFDFPTWPDAARDLVRRGS